MCLLNAVALNIRNWVVLSVFFFKRRGAFLIVFGICYTSVTFSFLCPLGV